MMVQYKYKRKNQSLGAWAKQLKKPYTLLYSRLNHMRWTVKDAFEKPVRPKIGAGMKVPRFYSMLRVNGKSFVFLYPKPQPHGYDFAEIRETREGWNLIPGRCFDGQPTQGLAFGAVARHFKLQDGDPVLAWLKGCFTAVRAHRVSRKIKEDILQAATEYRKKVSWNSLKTSRSGEHISMPWSKTEAARSRKGPGGRGVSGKRARSTPKRDL